MKRLLIRRLAAVIVCLMLLSLVGCEMIFKKPSPSTDGPIVPPVSVPPVTAPQTDVDETSDVLDTESETEPTIDPPDASIYDGLIAAYAAAYEAGYDEYQFAASDFSEMCVLGGGADAVGFTVTDVNGDAFPELVVARRADVYDLYTIGPDGSIRHLFTASDRTTCRIGSDGLVMQYDEDTSVESVRVFSRVERGAFVFVRRLACHYDEDDNAVWTLSEGDALSEQIISSAEADAVIDAFTGASFSLTLFSSVIGS